MAGLPTTASVIPRTTWYDFHVLWDMGTGIFSETAEVRLSYHRPVMLPYTASYATRLIPVIGVQSTSRVLVIGGGFGFLAEILLGQPYGLAADRVATQDTSTYASGARSETEEADINALLVGVGIDISSDFGKEAKGGLYDGGVRCRVRFTDSRLENQSAANSVKSMFPSSAIDFVITDDGFLNYHNDAEIAEIFASLDRLGAVEVWHLIYPNWGNAKDLETFKAMKPTHRFVDYWSGQTA
jgi:hypothetical protein